MGVLQLTGTMAIGTTTGLFAMWSRGSRIMPHVYESYTRNAPDAFATWSTTHPSVFLCAFAAVGTIALACWFTPLFLLLTRARNEFAAALGGVFLTIAALLWLMRIIMLMNGIDNDGASVAPWLAIAILNPLSPFLMVLTLTYANWLLPVLVVDLLVWIVLPLWWTCRNSGRVIGKWVNA